VAEKSMCSWRFYDSRGRVTTWNASGDKFPHRRRPRLIDKRNIDWPIASTNRRNSLIQLQTRKHGFYGSLTMSTPNSIENYAALIAAFCDFLTVTIHTILFERHIYPPDSFLSARKYNYTVRQSRHPKVCQWITDAVAAVETELLNGTVARIVVPIFSPKQRPVERFVFDLTKFPSVPKEDINTPFERSMSAVDVDEQFRAAMAKLRICSSTLKPAPEGCTFTVAIELKDAADPPIGHPQPWIPTQPSLQRHVVVNRDGEREERKRGEDLGGVRTTPVRLVDTGEMVFEMWVEEGKAKAETTSANSSSTGLG